MEIAKVSLLLEKDVTSEELAECGPGSIGLEETCVSVVVPEALIPVTGEDTADVVDKVDKGRILSVVQDADRTAKSSVSSVLSLESISPANNNSVFLPSVSGVHVKELPSMLSNSATVRPVSSSIITSEKGAVPPVQEKVNGVQGVRSGIV